MWCPNCKDEYQEGISLCPQCGAKLTDALPQETAKETWGRVFPGRAMKGWPFGADGRPERAAFLKHCTCNDLEDEMLIGMLEAYGIPAVKQYPQNGQLGKVVLGMSGNGADIFVPQSMAEDAIALIGGSCNE